MQRVQKTLSQGVDDKGKDYLQSAATAHRAQLSSKSAIVKTRHVTRTDRPMKGLVAFVLGLPTKAAMGSQGACNAALHQVTPMSRRVESSMGGWQHDRNEDRMHPGEDSA